MGRKKTSIVVAPEEPVAGETRTRSIEQLYVHPETLACAQMTRCVACCYKIVLYGRPGLMPNVRPEMCPRHGGGELSGGAASVVKRRRGCVGLYDSDRIKRVLTVGDGNFSYSLALAKGFAQAQDKVQLVATSHETKESVLETYPDGEAITKQLHDMEHVDVHHGIDATSLEHLNPLGQFDRVIWNFPCVRAPRGEDGQNSEMETNKQLLREFFAIAPKILTPTGEIHVTHKTKPPFGQWRIEQLAQEQKLAHVRSVIFDRCLYPGYSNKKVLSKSSFPIWDSLTFVFVPAEREQQHMSEEALQIGEQSLTPVTQKVLDITYLLLNPAMRFDARQNRTKKGSTHKRKLESPDGDAKDEPVPTKQKTEDKKDASSKKIIHSQTVTNKKRPAAAPRMQRKQRRR